MTIINKITNLTDRQLDLGAKMMGVIREKLDKMIYNGEILINELYESLKDK